MPISKSQGVTHTEKLLAELCESTFLKTWSYPNPYKYDGKELCDVIAVFENHIFLFFDRESKKFENQDGDLLVQWNRWEKEVIQKQLKTSAGASRYILENPGRVYLDPKCTIPFPIPIPTSNAIVHKIIVAHGASEACKNASIHNITGSLGIGYCKTTDPKVNNPFMVYLDKADPVHVLDSHNLEIILNELDTVYDFTTYLTAKEKAIASLDGLLYCGEEDLLAHYFLNFDKESKQHYIGVKDKGVNSVFVGEGEWQGLTAMPSYQRRKEANKVSVLWDDLLQHTCQNVLDETIGGNGNVLRGESAIYEMAKEPRFHRRALAQLMTDSIRNFPENLPGIVKGLSIMPSFYKDKAYVFFQLWHPNITDYDNEYRPRRQALLEIACGVTKNKFPHFNKIIGIAIDAPKFANTNAEDFILLNCSEWSETDRNEYEKLNIGFHFLESDALKRKIITVNDFPKDNNIITTPKIGRNDPCPCGSGKKYKKCCLN